MIAIRLFLAIGMIFLVVGPHALAQSTAAQGPSRQEELRKKREERKKDLKPYELTKGEKRAQYWEKFQPKIFTKGYAGFRALIGGMDDPAVFGAASSGAGLVGGVGYQYGLDNRNFRFRVDARYSTKKYEQIEAHAEFPTPLSQSVVQGFVNAAYRDYKEINFFGLGPDSSVDNKSTYRLEDRRIGGGFKIEPNRFFFLVGGLGFLNTHVKSGESFPSVEDIFPVEEQDDLTVLGIVDPPEYVLYGGTLGLNFFDREFPEAGAGLLLAVERYDAQDGDLFNFTRITGDFSTEIPLKYRNRRIAFRFRTVHHLADAGNDVPFYLLETIGGGTTFRGYDNYRFRDRRYLLMNLEYRWEVWTYADFVLLADAGKVFRRAADFDFSDLEFGYGFGILVRTPAEGRLGRYGRFRIDFTNSHEGFRVFIGSGPGLGRRLPPIFQ